MSDINEREPIKRRTKTWLEVGKSILKPMASLQLTVVLFALGTLLVFFGTLAQKDTGIWTVVDKYFYSMVVWVDWQLFVQFAQVFFKLDPNMTVSGSFPFPAGKLIGWAMFFNLLAAHLLRFKLTWKRSGIFILHGGVLLMLAGEYVTREFQIEQRMTIAEGQASNTALDIRDAELAFLAPGSTPTEERFTTVPMKMLMRSARKGERIAHPDLPADVQVTRWMLNTGEILWQKHAAPSVLADWPRDLSGSGAKVLLREKPEISGTDTEQTADMPAALVNLYRKGTNELLGKYLVAINLSLRSIVEKVTVDGQEHTFHLRFTEYRKPFKLTALKVTHEVYPGTTIPKNYCSRVRIEDPELGVNREVDISMNEPLRYRGEAFYQSGVNTSPDATTSTVLQVVRNPGWTLPYVSCLLVTLGMAVHFLIYLVQYLRRNFYVTGPRPESPPAGTTIKITPVLKPERPPLHWAVRYAGVAGVVVSALYLTSSMFPSNLDGKIDLSKLAGLPVLDGGRIKPLDTVARVDLRRLNERESVAHLDGHKLSAIRWYMDVASSTRGNFGAAKEHAAFRITNLEVISLLKLKPRASYRYSPYELFQDRANFAELTKATTAAAAVPSKQRTAFEEKVLELSNHVKLYFQIAQGGGALALPPRDGKPWRSFADVNEEAMQDLLNTIGGKANTRFESIPELVRFLESIAPDGEKATEEQQAKLRDEIESGIDQQLAKLRDRDPDAASWAAVLSAYRLGNAARFDDAVAKHYDLAWAALTPGERFGVNLELFLNRFAPYFHVSNLYGTVLALCLIGWGLGIVYRNTAEGLRRAAFWTLLVTFLVHTFTLFARMYLMDRPLVFVTNLYSSAVFIGWAAAGVCLLIEWIFPIGLGNFVAAAVGLGTCIIGHNLAVMGGDTLEMMQAVLDTNLWLATHVTTVTFGYSATYIAGAIGLVYLVVGLFTPALSNSVNLSGDPSKKPQTLGKLYGQAMYGVLCAATLFSFLGTVLGGIWADQSWGRFWGWDPKENGAVMIVLWNALILHARWCGLVKNRGTAILTLIGNMITTWSWFGTNQLGVGLHAYGFSNTLAAACLTVWVSHIALLAVALSVPPSMWRSDLQKS